MLSCTVIRPPPWVVVSLFVSETGPCKESSTRSMIIQASLDQVVTCILDNLVVIVLLGIH